jgi:hypothetical protein
MTNAHRNALHINPFLARKNVWCSAKLEVLVNKMGCNFEIKSGQRSRNVEPDAENKG